MVKFQIISNSSRNPPTELNINTYNEPCKLYCMYYGEQKFAIAMNSL